MTVCISGEDGLVHAVDDSLFVCEVVNFIALEDHDVFAWPSHSITCLACYVCLVRHSQGL